MPWLDLKTGILEEFSDAIRHSRWRVDYGELAARSGPTTYERERLDPSERRARDRAQHQAWYAANVEKRRASCRAYYERHRAAIKERRQAEYTPQARRLKYLCHRETDCARNRAYSKRYYDARKDDPAYRARARAKSRAYYEAHRDAMNARRRRT